MVDFRELGEGERVTQITLTRGDAQALRTAIKAALRDNDTPGHDSGSCSTCQSLLKTYNYLKQDDIWRPKTLADQGPW